MVSPGFPEFIPGRPIPGGFRSAALFIQIHQFIHPQLLSFQFPVNENFFLRMSGFHPPVEVWHKIIFTLHRYQNEIGFQGNVIIVVIAFHLVVGTFGALNRSFQLDFFTGDNLTGCQHHE
jgi:hypothetical protein